MTELIVADDEKNIRAGLLKILSESFPGQLRIREAKNGEEALALAQDCPADIVITDIRMPKVDGVGLMRALSAFANPPSIIVLSGYDDFSYAREAIRSGARAYILKPVDRIELISVVALAAADCERRRKSAVENALSRIAREGRIPGDLDCGIPVSGGDFRYVFSFARPDATVPGTAQPDEAARYPATVAASSARTRLLDRIEALPFCYIVERSPVAVGCILDSSAATRFASELSALPVVSGASKSFRNLSFLRTARKQAQIAACGYFFNTSVALFEYDNTEQDSRESLLDEALRKLSSLIPSGKAEAAADLMRNILDFSPIPAAGQSRRLWMIHEYLTSSIVGRYWDHSEKDMYFTLKTLMAGNLFGFASLDEYCSATADLVYYIASRFHSRQAEYPFISEALAYIEEHCTEDINMTVVANHVSVNYSWFSEKFKEQTGVNFNEYLKRLRIAEAKRLLGKGCYKVYEVSSLSGFGDVKHFMKTFKEETGCSPGEYRRLYLD